MKNYLLSSRQCYISKKPPRIFKRVLDLVTTLKANPPITKAILKTHFNSISFKFTTINIFIGDFMNKNFFAYVIVLIDLK